jgi:hypothetical protein
MPDPQQEPTVWLKARSRLQKGMFRAGQFVGVEETYLFVTEEQAKRIEGESAFVVERVSESEVPDHLKPVRESGKAPNGDDAVQLLKNADFPREARGPGGAPTPPLGPDPLAGVGTTTATPTTNPLSTEPIQPPSGEQGPGESTAGPPREDEPKSETIVATPDGTSSDTTSSRKRR